MEGSIKVVGLPEKTIPYKQNETNHATLCHMPMWEWNYEWAKLQAGGNGEVDKKWCVVKENPLP